jgi:PilZ domain
MAQQSARSHTQSGRLHRRIPLMISVKLADPREPEAPSQDGMTENVSPWGARVIVGSPREPNELLLLNTPAPGIRVSARVIYCEPLSGAKFVVGLQLQGTSVNWKNIFPDGAV